MKLLKLEYFTPGFPKFFFRIAPFKEIKKAIAPPPFAPLLIIAPTVRNRALYLIIKNSTNDI